MSEFSAILPGGRNQTDYGTIPTEAEFFEKLMRREAALTALNQNAVGGGAGGIKPLEEGRPYRLSLINRINRQSPFDKYLVEVWGKVQESGWATGEKFRLAKLFGTSDDWQIAFLLAKSTFEKKEAEAVRVSYAENNIGLSSYVTENMENVGPRGGVGAGNMIRAFGQ